MNLKTSKLSVKNVVKFTLFNIKKLSIDKPLNLCYTIDTKRKEIIKMAKTCPVWAEDCPHFKRMCINGEWDCYCELSHPEEDCDDYIYYNGEDEED